MAGSLTLAAGSRTLIAPSAVFAAADIGKTAIILGAGPSGGALTTTIVGYTSPTTVTLAAAATAAPAATGAGSYILTWGTDDTAALQAAISAANAAMTAGSYPCVYAPGGNYLISSPPGGFGLGLPGCVMGDGPIHTAFWLTPGFAGDLFAWSEAWIPLVSGPVARDIRIDGWQGAAGQQNALMYYDRNDNVTINDVDVWALPGQAFRSGIAKNTAFGFMRESRIDQLRIFNSGKPSIPAMEFNNLDGGGDATNEISIGVLNIYGSNGPSLVIRNSGTTTAGGITIDYLRVEGTENGTTAADLVTIGDPVLTGQVAAITLRDAMLIDPYTNFPALRLTAASLAAAPFFVHVDQGSIGGGLANGKGLEIDAGHDNRFHFSSIGTTGTNVTVGSSALVGTNNFIDGDGHEVAWTYAIDPTSYLFSPVWRQGVPSANPALVLTPHNGSPVSGGPGLGNGAVDLQTARFAATQIASGANSGILSGSNNSAGGQNAVIGGGIANIAAGFVGTIAGGTGNVVGGNFNAIGGGASNSLGGVSSAIPGGQAATDRNRNNWIGWASGKLVNQGDAQTGKQLLIGQIATATGLRLTSDQLAASAVNIVNIPVGTAYHTLISATCRDVTSGSLAAWDQSSGLLWRAATATVNYSGGYSAATAPTRVSGGLSAATLAITPDSTNEGLSVVITPPAGNTDTIHCAALAATTEEVQ
jgi:hypothetical protein